MEVRRASGFSLLSLFSFAFSFSISSPSRSSRLLLRQQPKRRAKAWLGCPGHPERERERGERSEGLASIVRSRLSFNFCVTLLWVELSRSLLCEGFCYSLFRILAKIFFPFFLLFRNIDFISILLIFFRFFSFLILFLYLLGLLSIPES